MTIPFDLFLHIAGKAVTFLVEMINFAIR